VINGKSLRLDALDVLYRELKHQVLARERMVAVKAGLLVVEVEDRQGVVTAGVVLAGDDVTDGDIRREMGARNLEDPGLVALSERLGHRNLLNNASLRLETQNGTLDHRQGLIGTKDEAHGSTVLGVFQEDAFGVLELIVERNETTFTHVGRPFDRYDLGLFVVIGVVTATTFAPSAGLSLAERSAVAFEEEFNDALD